KKLLAFDKIHYPDFVVLTPSAGLEPGSRLRFPLLVKPLRKDSAMGIGTNALVHTTRELTDRVMEIHDKLHDAALAEEYIEGRDLWVGARGNRDPIAFPPLEMDASGLPDGVSHGFEARARWDERSAELRGTRAVVADVPPELRARLERTALDAYRAMRVRD